jgi:hypothetical protein
MRRLLQLAAALLLVTTLAPAQAVKKPKPAREDVEWLWQYTPDDTNKQGRENDLVQDARFRPLLDQFLTAPQTFRSQLSNGKYKPLADAALDLLTVPGSVLADDNRYISISGCVVHFCPSRGLLWIDLNGAHHLVVFAAIDWIKADKLTSDPAAEYTLWLFSNDPLPHPPAALLRAIARWTAQPLPGSAIVQNITHAILVDPDGTPHELAPSTLGVTPPPHSP